MRKLVGKITAGEQFAYRVKWKFSLLKLTQLFCYTLRTVKILALVAGTNDPSNSDRLAESFLEGAKLVDGIEVQKLRIKDFPLPHFTLDCYAAGCPMPPEFLTLKSLVLEADGILIASPIWNFGVPAHLKNFIDWMGCFALDTETKSRGTLGGKPFYFIFTGGAPLAAWKGLMRFTTLFVSEAIRYFGGTVTGKHFEGKCTLGRGKFGFMMDTRPESIRSVQQKGMKFAEFTKKFKQTGVLPFSYRVFEKAYHIGKHTISKL